MVKLILENVSKYYTNLVAVNQINLTIDEGEFFSLLGPSGSGKTTFLRIVSGVLSPSKGRLYFNSKEVTRVSQSKRNIGYVPQNNSLQPHLTVGENIANGLKKYNITRNEVNKRTNESLFLVGLPDVFNKLPKLRMECN